MGNRWELISKFIGGKKSIQVVTNMVNELKSKTLKGPDAMMRQIEKCIEESDARREAKAQKPEEIKMPAQPVATEEIKKPEEPVKAETQDGEAKWTQPEQLSLQKAMKEYPASMGAKVRWEKIAEFVGGGKTKKDCLNRVKEIKGKMSKA